jgi:hypothetical protein
VELSIIISEGGKEEEEEKKKLPKIHIAPVQNFHLISFNYWTVNKTNNYLKQLGNNITCTLQ